MSIKQLKPKRRLRCPKKGGGTCTSKAAEFILKEGVIPVLVVEPYGPTFAQVIEKLNEDLSVQVAECSSYTEVVSIARRVEGCVVLCHAAEPSHLAKHITMLKFLNKEIQKKQVRTIATIKFFDGALDSKLDVYGCSEIVNEPIASKSLLFKVERHLRTLAQTASRAQSAPVSLSPSATPSIQHAAAAGIDIRENTEVESFAETVRLGPALAIESDFWLLAGGGAKMVGGRWTVRLTGPGPTLGHWIKSNKEDYWEWIPSDPNTDPFIKEQGSWMFKGQKPEFQEGLWLFVAKDPELSFYYENECYGSKLSIDDEKSLLVARDSQAARAALPLIQKSIKNILNKNEAKHKVLVEPQKEIKAAPAVESTEPTPEQEKVAAEEISAAFRLVEPLKIKSDCWLLQDRRPRWIADRWAIRLLGPGPLVGRWVQTETDDPNQVEQSWKWVPAGSILNPFIKEPGDWVFRGIQPKFQDDSWVFVGRKPRLAFLHDGRSYGDRITVDQDGILLVAWDSEIARGSLRDIEKSFEKVIATETKPLIQAAAPSELQKPAASLDPIRAEVSAPPPPVVEERVYLQQPMTAPGPEKVKPLEPPGPTLSPLALALLVSELVSKQGLEPRKMIQRYCAYVSASCGGLRVEAWFTRPDGTPECLASHDGSPGVYGETAGNAEKIAKMLDQGILIAPVPGGFKTQSMILGSLSLGGTGVELVSVQYAQAAGHMLSGLYQALALELASPALRAVS